MKKNILNLYILLALITLGASKVRENERLYRAAFKPPYTYTKAEAVPVDEKKFNSGISLYSYQWYIKNRGKAPVIGFVKDGFETATGIIPERAVASFGTYMVDSQKGFDINLEKAWEVYDKLPERREVVVAVIDTGTDIYHDDLNKSIWKNKAEVKDEKDNDGNGYTDDINGWNFVDENNLVYTGEKDAHGTHEVGIIAAAWDGLGISGIADSTYVKIMPIKILEGASKTGTGKNIKEAIEYAEKMGADIVNLSLTASVYDEDLYRLMKKSKMLFVVSAGNGELGTGFNLDERPVYPAAYELDNIISVANKDIDGKLEKSSNFGAKSVDIAVPGSSILSTLPNNKYGLKSGTSMSAAVVSGAAALVYSARTDMDRAYLKEALLNSVKRDFKLAGKVLSSGYLDVYEAIKYVRR